MGTTARAALVLATIALAAAIWMGRYEVEQHYNSSLVLDRWTGTVMRCGRVDEGCSQVATTVGRPAPAQPR